MMCITCGCHNETLVISENTTRLIELETDLLEYNNQFANSNRQHFNQKGIVAVNLLSSPGSGKTSLLVKTISDLKPGMSISVIEGDQQTDNDARRIRETGANVIQINTGKICHLDAQMINESLVTLLPPRDSILFIENVGNLVCPAGFDLGERIKVVILSVTEGEDKPIKYPDMFSAANVMLLNKCDLLPYLEFDVNKCIEYARQINPELLIIILSAKTGEGMSQWYGLLRTLTQKTPQPEPIF